MPEESQDFFEGLVLRLRHFLVRENPKNSQEHAERKKRVVFERSLKQKEQAKFQR